MTLPPPPAGRWRIQCLSVAAGACPAKTLGLDVPLSVCLSVCMRGVKAKQRHTGHPKEKRIVPVGIAMLYGYSHYEAFCSS